MLTVLDFKVLIQNYTALSLIIVFVNYFSTAGAEASNSPTVKFTPRSKIRLIIIVALTNSFNILITHEYFFLSIVFFGPPVSASSIVVSWKGLKVKAEIGVGAGIEISLMGSYSPNLKFFDIA